MRAAVLVLLVGCKDQPPAPAPPPPPPHVFDGPIHQEWLFGPYASLHDYCAAKSDCCCEGGVTALDAPATPSGPWLHADLLRGPDDPTGPWHLVVQTKAGWFGEFIGFKQSAGDSTTVTPTMKIDDSLELGSPQIALDLKYHIKNGAENAIREGMFIVGVGSSGTPSILSMMLVHLDQTKTGGGVGWMAKAAAAGKGKLEITNQIGEPKNLPIGTFPVSFP